MESCVSLGESELNRPISGPQQVGFAARIVCEDNFLTSLGLKEGRRVSSVFNAGYPHGGGSQTHRDRRSPFRGHMVEVEQASKMPVTSGSVLPTRA